jgi:hypothetical protein
VATLLVAAACSGGGGHPAQPGATTASGSPAFSVSGTEVQAVAQPPPPFPDDVRTKVTAVLDRYLQEAVVSPLRSGQRAGDLAPVFTAAALPRLEGPDRAALVDEGLPKAGDLRADAATARLGALTGSDNAVVAVTATVDVRMQTGGSDPVTISRTGDLVLVPDGDGWKIDGYDLRTARDSPDGATTPTAHG